MSDEQNQQTGDSSNATAMCCAQFYEQDIVQELMGGSYHPGGEALSLTLAQELGLNAGTDVLDVACGVGTMTRLMAFQLGLNATGLDFGEVNVQKAKALTQEAIAQGKANPAAGSGDEPCCAPGDPCCTPNDSLTQLGGSENPTVAIEPGVTDFVQGSADSLPFAEAKFDGLTCECAVSTFADQTKVAEEFYRVLKPGGVFGMTDMVLNGELPTEFAEKVAPWTCMAKALTADGYTQLFEAAGFKRISLGDHSHTLIELATDMKRKLVMAGMGKALGALPGLGLNLSEMRGMLATATELVKAGTVQYGSLVFKK